MADEQSKKTTGRCQDFLRGHEEEITLRFDPNDVAELACHSEYDPQLSRENGRRVRILRNVEVQNPDGSWSPYPSVTWLDGVEDEEQLETRALVKKGDGLSVMISAQGVPDGQLMLEAQAAGIYTESIG